MNQWQDVPVGSVEPNAGTLIPYVPPNPAAQSTIGQISRNAFQAWNSTVNSIAHLFHREPGTALEKINQLSQKILQIQKELIQDKQTCENLRSKTFTAYTEAINSNQKASGKLSMLFNLILKLKTDLSTDLSLEKLVGYNPGQYPSYPVETSDTLQAMQQFVDQPNQLAPKFQLETINSMLAIIFPLYKKLVALKMQTLGEYYRNDLNGDTATLFVENSLEASFLMREQMAAELFQEIHSLNRTLQEFTGKTATEAPSYSLLTKVWTKNKNKTEVPPSFFGQLMRTYEEEAEKARLAKKEFMESQLQESRAWEAYKNKFLLGETLKTQKNALEQSLLVPSAPLL